MFLMVVFTWPVKSPSAMVVCPIMLAVPEIKNKFCLLMVSSVARENDGLLGPYSRGY